MEMFVADETIVHAQVRRNFSDAESLFTTPPPPLRVMVYTAVPTMAAMRPHMSHIFNHRSKSLRCLDVNRFARKSRSSEGNEVAAFSRHEPGLGL